MMVETTILLAQTDTQALSFERLPLLLGAMEEAVNCRLALYDAAMGANPVDEGCQQFDEWDRMCCRHLSLLDAISDLRCSVDSLVESGALDVPPPQILPRVLALLRRAADVERADGWSLLALAIGDGTGALSCPSTLLR